MKRHPSPVGIVLASLLGLTLVGCSDDDGQQNNNTIHNNNNTIPPDCGDGIIQSTEECDDGTMNSDVTPNVCRADCTLPECGDGVVDSAAPYNEQCDPPNGTTCLADCTLPQTACDEADTFDTDCETATTGQYCWDGGVAGGPLFCGCEYNSDCRIAGYKRCNETTHQCEQTPDCGEDSNEPNDTESTATSLSLGTPGSGAICEWDDDWFTFTTGSGDNAATITVTWTDDGETDLDLRITDCADMTLASGWSSESAQEEVEVEDLEPSTAYCAMVSHYSGPAGGGDVSYSINVVASFVEPPCILDSDCSTVGDYCPYVGDDAGTCVSTPPANSGCGDNVAGDNDTSQNAEVLSSGTPVTEGTCDGEPDNPLDVDWFKFTAAQGDAVNITVDQTGENTNGDVDVRLYDSNGDLVGSAVSFTDPEVIEETDLAAGDYYIVVKFYDRQTGTPMSDTYTITMTLNP